MNITYDSDKQSSNSQPVHDHDDDQHEHSQYSSDQQQQMKSIPLSQIAQYKKQIRLKKAIAYRYLMQKQQELIGKLFNNWAKIVQQSRLSKQQNNDSNMTKAINFNNQILANKAFDGIIEYATVSISFRNKLVLFYYKFVIGRYFNAWKDGHRSGVIKDEQEQYGGYGNSVMGDGRSLAQTMNQVNKNLDSIFSNKDNKDKASGYAQNEKFATTTSKMNKKTSIQLTNEPKQTPEPNKFPSLSSINRATEFISSIHRKQQQHNTQLAFKSIKTYIKLILPPRQLNNNNIGNANKNSPSVQPIQNYQKYYRTNDQHQPPLPPIQSQQQYRNSTEQEWRRHTAYDRIQLKDSRSRDMLQSRKSTATIYRNVINDDDEHNKSKSRRKLKPIVQQVSLPSFSKKNSDISSQNQERYLEKRTDRQINREREITNDGFQPKNNDDSNRSQVSRKIQFRESSNSKSKEKEQQISRQRQIQKHKQKLKQQQQQQQKQKQRRNQQIKKQQQQIQRQKQKQKSKQQKQQNKNKILALITQNKLMQLTLMNELHEQSNVLNKYKDSTVQLLKKIRSI